MQNLKNFTHGQKVAMLEMLINSTSNTPADNKLKFALMDELAEGDRTKDYGVITCMGYAKVINIDTFGEDYRQKWAKIRENGKGRYFNNSYAGGRQYI